MYNKTIVKSVSGLNSITKGKFLKIQDHSVNRPAAYWAHQASDPRWAHQPATTVLNIYLYIVFKSKYDGNLRHHKTQIRRIKIPYKLAAILLN